MEKCGEWVLFASAALLAAFGFGWTDEAGEGFVLVAKNPHCIRVMTWNLGGGGDQGGVAMSDDWISPVAESLKVLDADLVFLQELQDVDQYDRLLAELGHPWRGESVRQQDRLLAVVFQSGQLRARRIWTGTRRPAIGVVFRPTDGPGVAAVALHADAYSASRRNRQIGRSLDFLMNRTDEAAKILVGDLNLDMDLGKRRDLFSDNEYQDVESYNYIAAKLTDVGRGRGSTADPSRRLDYIFVNNRLQAVRAGPWRDRRVGEMDHDPVAADLQLSGL